MKNLILIMLLLAFAATASAQKNPHYEFRAVWIATVENIDWPSKRTLSSDEQKAEYIKILDLHKRNGMNAVVMQIRPVTDAFYPSKYEPWSEYLTGKQGQAPSPYYDPLQFMIEETHKRGMEFHAWMNPYRAVFNVARSSVSSDHVTRRNPKWFVTYGNTKYFDPGIPEAQQHVTRVVKDVVERYDLDAIHFDDYFYPYKIPGKEFPDAASFAKYGNGMSRDDWRRSNVDSIIKMLSVTIKKANPRVKFGISPFGVWRNKSKDPMGSNTKAGPTNYDELYADVLLWLKKDWIDYIVPQLYWEIGHPLCDYNVLLDWWSKYTFGKQLFIGHGIYRALESRTGGWKTKTEIPNQIKALRKYEDVQGSVYFSSKTFNSNPNGWNDSLRNNYYKHPAIIPPMKWIDSIPPLKPLMEKITGSKYTRVMYRGAEPIKGFVVYSVPTGKALTMPNSRIVDILVADKYIEVDPSSFALMGSDRLMIATIDKNNNISEWVSLK
jgi:uncharacterized lipoprotein YddW (UPF0748 family)